MTTLLVAGCFFLLLAIFGVEVARYVQTLPKPTRAKSEEKLGLQVLDWRRHDEGQYSVLLSDGTVWQGRSRWWGSSSPNICVPLAHIHRTYVPFLGDFYLRAEAAFQKGHPISPLQSYSAETPDWCKQNLHAS